MHWLEIANRERVGELVGKLVFEMYPVQSTSGRNLCDVHACDPVVESKSGCTLSWTCRAMKRIRRVFHKQAGDPVLKSRRGHQLCGVCTVLCWLLDTTASHIYLSCIHITILRAKRGVVWISTRLVCHCLLVGLMFTNTV